jgi:hypothetical protein
MDTLLSHRFEVCEATDPDARNEIYRFRYRIYVEQMGRRQKYADHALKRIVEPLDETARNYAAYFNGNIVGTIRGNRFSERSTAYYRKLYRIDDRFPYYPDEMSLTTKLMFDPAMRGSAYPIRMIVHYARDFNARRPCKIDFVDCNRGLLPFFLKLGYVDYLGWVFHSEYGSVRPLFCPADQVARLQHLRSPLAAVARDVYDNNMFGGEDLVQRLALAETGAPRLRTNRRRLLRSNDANLQRESYEQDQDRPSDPGDAGVF